MKVMHSILFVPISRDDQSTLGTESSSRTIAPIRSAGASIISAIVAPVVPAGREAARIATHAEMTSVIVTTNLNGNRMVSIATGISGRGPSMEKKVAAARTTAAPAANIQARSSGMARVRPSALSALMRSSVFIPNRTFSREP